MQSSQGIGLYLQKYVCNLIKILAFTSRNICTILPGSWLLTVDTSMQSYQGLAFTCRNIDAILSGPWLLPAETFMQFYQSLYFYLQKHLCNLIRALAFTCRNIKAVLSGFWFLPAETLMQSYQGYGFYLQKYDTPVVDKIWPFYIWIPGLSWSISSIFWGWSGGAKVLCILHHWGVQLILAYSWARPAILVVGKGRGGMFLFLLFLHFHSFLFLFLPCPSLSSPLLSLLSLFSLSLGDDTKWPSRVDVSLNPNTINPYQC